MRYRPADITDQQVRDALGGGWEVTYAPVGAGSYHWIATDGPHKRFVTVDDLDTKPWLGETRQQVRDGLRAVMRAAQDLRDLAGLDFAAAPDGPTRQLTDRYTITVFRYLDGTTGSWDDRWSLADRETLLGMLAAIHSASFITTVPISPIELPGRSTLETALGELGRPWAGPHGDQARALLAEHAGQLRRNLDRYDRLAVRVEALPKVLTHGEPHPGNVLRTTTGRLMLLDWDTAGLAPAERDLWLLGADTGGDPAALAFYRLRWPLLDVVLYISDLRTAAPGQDVAAQVIRYLRKSLTELAERAAEEI